MKKMHPEFKNNCPICKARQLEIRFIDHIIEEHKSDLNNKDSVNECKNCKTQFLPIDYVKHAEKCSIIKNQFKCYKCDRNVTWKELVVHFENNICPIPKAISTIIEHEIPEEEVYTPQIKIIYTPSNGKTDRKKS
jgi:hypothetical protein